MESNIKTLNKDWELIQKSNQKFDLNFVAGDLSNVTDKDSLKNAIILKCMTGYEELYKTGNSIYSEFGNRAYEVIKDNKTEMTFFKVKQYFTQAIQEIRRVKTINELIVTNNDSTSGFDVYFNVTSINGETVSGELTLAESNQNLTPTLQIVNKIPWCNPRNPLSVDFILKDELNNPIQNEIIYVFINDKFYKIAGFTDKNGHVNFRYVPRNNSENTIYGSFKGNMEFNFCNSEKLVFESET